MSESLNVTVTRLTPEDAWKKATSSTAGGRAITKTTWQDMLASEHSPIRTQLYWVELDNLFSYVSVHLVRHKIGVEHYVESKRVDRGGTGKEDRYTLVKHSMAINAQALINMSLARLCTKADIHARHAWCQIKAAVMSLDPTLGRFMVPMCVYLGGLCFQGGTCPIRKPQPKPYWME